MVDSEEVWELEEKGFARIWGAPKRISESPQEIKQREEYQRILRLNRGIERLSNEYLETKTTKKIKKRKENGWDEVHEEIFELPYCERQEQLTKVFLCLKCSNCLITGECVACHKKKRVHKLVDEQEAWDLEEKGFVVTW